MFNKRTISRGLFIVLVIGFIGAPVFAYGGAKSWVYVDERMYPERTTDEAPAVVEIRGAEPVSAEKEDSLIDSSGSFIGNSVNAVGDTFKAGADVVGKTAAEGANGVGWLFMAVYGSIFNLEREEDTEYKTLEIEEPEPTVIKERKLKYYPRYHGRVGQWAIS